MTGKKPAVYSKRAGRGAPAGRDFLQTRRSANQSKPVTRQSTKRISAKFMVLAIHL